jgi:hypothetical protein
VATGLYLVVVAELSAVQLVLIGAFQGVTVLVAEVPAGVLADTVSRRLSLVISHVVRGSGMVMAGLVTGFPLLVVSQCLWGLGWAFSSGADVAWLTDELDRPELVDRTLTAQARWDLLGALCGITAFGGLAWATSLSTAIVMSGVAMMALGIVVARWPENDFTPADAGRRWADAASILRRGVTLARTDRVILAVVAATFLVNGGAEAYGRLFERRLVGLGMPTHPDPIVWFAALAIVGGVLGAVVLRIVELRIDGKGVARRTYVCACVAGVVGLLLFAQAPNPETAVAGTLLVSGISLPVIRAAGTIWVNRRTTSDVRATVHSVLSQAEQAGEIVFGLTLAVVAGVASSTVALMGSVVLLAAAGAVAAKATRGISDAPSDLSLLSPG